MRRLAAPAALLASAACGAPGKPPAPAPAPPRLAAQPGDLVIASVTVVPMDRDGALPHRTVIVRGDRIVAVEPADRVDVPAGATRVDGAGKWLMPGLADMHVHTWSEHDLTLFVAAGVTTVRVLWGSPHHLRWRAEIGRGERLGPTLVTASPIIDGDPPVWPGSTVLANPADADRIVGELKAQGYDFLKPYSRLSREAYDALAAAGRRHGMRLAGHVPRAVGLRHVLASRQHTIEHLDGWLPALLPPAWSCRPARRRPPIAWRWRRSTRRASRRSCRRRSPPAPGAAPRSSSSIGSPRSRTSPPPASARAGCATSRRPSASCGTPGSTSGSASGPPRASPRCGRPTRSAAGSPPRSPPPARRCSSAPTPATRSSSPASRCTTSSRSSSPPASRAPAPSAPPPPAPPSTSASPATPASSPPARAPTSCSSTPIRSLAPLPLVPAGVVLRGRWLPRAELEQLLAAVERAHDTPETSRFAPPPPASDDTEPCSRGLQGARRVAVSSKSCFVSTRRSCSR